MPKRQSPHIMLLLSFFIFTMGPAIVLILWAGMVIKNNWIMNGLCALVGAIITASLFAFDTWLYKQYLGYGPYEQ